MANQLNIQVGADVSGAVRGLQQLESQTNRSFRAVAQSSGTAQISLINLSRVAQDAPYGFLGIANNINPLVESFGKLRTETGSTRGAFKALAGSLAGAGGLSFAVGVASSLLLVFGDRLFNTKKKAEETDNSAKKLKDSIGSIYSDVAREASNVTSLVAVLNNETESRNRKLAAIKQLQQIQPEIFNGLKLEGSEVKGLTSAYDAYVESLKTTVAAKIKQAQLEEQITKLLKLQGVTLTADEQALQAGVKQLQNYVDQQTKGSVVGSQIADKRKKESDQQKRDIQATQSEINKLTADLGELSKGIKIPPIKPVKAKEVKDAFKDVFKLDLSDIAIPGNEFITFDTNQAIRDGAILGQSFNEGVRKALETGREVSPENLKAKKFADDYEKNIERIKATNNLIANNITGVVGSAISGLFDALKRGENAFAAFGNAAINALLGVIEKLAATAAAAAILSFIFPGGVGGAKGFGAIFNNLIGLRANGGPVSGNAPYIVGERGPELFVPSVSGNILPNNQLGSFNGRSGFGTSGMGGRSIVRGNDILLAYARTQRSISRVNA